MQIRAARVRSLGRMGLLQYPVELAVYADALAGEAAALSARAERVRSRLRVAAIEREARSALGVDTVARLQELGLLVEPELGTLRAELRGLEESLAALEALQAWVEQRLAATDLSAA
jgi:hypothetical protein